MASLAWREWDTTAKARLDELERVHHTALGSGPGRRWGTEQLNRSLFVVLLAQFQTYCRDLHDEAAAIHLLVANPCHADVLHTLITQGRDLDHKNPRAGALGSDFGRLGIRLVPSLKATGQGTTDALRRLALLVDFRNAVAHGNESGLAVALSTGGISATLRSFRTHRGSLNRLVVTMDRVVSGELASRLQIAPPW